MLINKQSEQNSVFRPVQAGMEQIRIRRMTRADI